MFDCSAAGLIVESFVQFAMQRNADALRHNSGMYLWVSSRFCFFSTSTYRVYFNLVREASERMKNSRAPSILKDSILLAACASNELLPMNPEFPADVFTSCLTTPIKMALRWFAMRSVLSDISPDMVGKIPGRPNDRKTPLGELNWIFTAVTDTIAWNVLPRGTIMDMVMMR